MLKSKPQKSLTVVLLCVLCLVLCALSFTQEQFIYDEKNKRNPFIPLVTADGRLINLEQEGKSELAIEGIIYDENGISYAIINGEVVRIGDSIGDYQVFKIEIGKVILLKGGQPTELQLKGEEE